MVLLVGEWRTRKRGTKKQRGLKFQVKSKEKTVAELMKKNPKWLTIVKAKGSGLSLMVIRLLLCRLLLLWRTNGEGR